MSDPVEKPVHLIAGQEPQSTKKSFSLVLLADKNSREIIIATLNDFDSKYVNEYLSHKEKGKMTLQSLTKQEVSNLTNL